ncbi:MAG: response regulator transcription factor [Chloroflexi bacterium]|nr:response regulator transcription factor [Chloroflexota bacterium]
MRVLIIEDDERLADVVARGLRQAGMAVDVALDGEEGLEKALVTRYDVVLLDRPLPRMHGDDVCRELAGRPEAPRILMLTASGSLDDRVEGLSLGADDYLPKPFALRELEARARALARRSAVGTPPVLEAADVRLEPGPHRATRGGRDLRLTRKEFAVLEVLLGARGNVVSAEELLERAWDEHADPMTNVVAVTVMTLRRKLGTPPVIETVTGVGYRIDP